MRASARASMLARNVLDMEREIEELQAELECLRRESAVTRFNMQKFAGAVVMKDYMFMEDGHDYRAFVGVVSIIEASKMTGFDVGKNEANWVARIESKDGSRSVNIPGCQVRAVLQGDRYANADGARVYYCLG